MRLDVIRDDVAARIELDDGTSLVLDRSTDLSIEDAARTARLNDGVLIADVAQVDGSPSAWLRFPAGSVRVIGTKLVLTAAADRAG